MWVHCSATVCGLLSRCAVHLGSGAGSGRWRHALCTFVRNVCRLPGWDACAAAARRRRRAAHLPLHAWGHPGFQRCSRWCDPGGVRVATPLVATRVTPDIPGAHACTAASRMHMYTCDSVSHDTHTPPHPSPCTLAGHLDGHDMAKSAIGQ